ncbi:hypothetical protein [Bacillus sp. FSL K6-3431]
MPDTDEILILIRELGRLFDEYKRSPEQFKPAIIEDIYLLGIAISSQE